MSDIIALILIGLIVWSAMTIRAQKAEAERVGHKIDGGIVPYLVLIMEISSASFNFMLGYSLATMFFGGFVVGIIGGAMVASLNFSYGPMARYVIGSSAHKKNPTHRLMGIGVVVLTFVVSQTAFSTHLGAMFDKSDRLVLANQKQRQAADHQMNADIAWGNNMRYTAQRDNNKEQLLRADANISTARATNDREQAELLKNAPMKYDWTTFGFSLTNLQVAMLISLVFEALLISLAFHTALFLDPIIDPGKRKLLDKVMDWDHVKSYKNFLPEFFSNESEDKKKTLPSSSTADTTKSQSVEKKVPASKEKPANKNNPTSKNNRALLDHIQNMKAKGYVFSDNKITPPKGHSSKLIQDDMNAFYSLRGYTVPGYKSAIVPESVPSQSQVSPIAVPQQSQKPVENQRGNDMGTIRERYGNDKGTTGEGVSFRAVTNAGSVSEKRKALKEVVYDLASDMGNDQLPFPKGAVLGLKGETVTEVFQELVKEGVLKEGRPYKILALRAAA